MASINDLPCARTIQAGHGAHSCNICHAWGKEDVAVKQVVGVTFPAGPVKVATLLH